MASSSNSQAPLPLHLCFFALILFLLVGLSWYSSYEPMMEGMMDQVKMALMLSPLLLLLVLHLVSNYDHRGALSSMIPIPERESLHRAGGTPWGVGLLLVILFFMVSHHSDIQERWFPLLSK